MPSDMTPEWAELLIGFWGDNRIARLIGCTDQEVVLQIRGTAGKWDLTDSIPDEYGGLLAAAPDLARAYLDEHERAERAERERDEARAMFAAAVERQKRAEADCDEARRDLARLRSLVGARQGLDSWAAHAREIATRQLDPWDELHTPTGAGCPGPLRVRGEE